MPCYHIAALGGVIFKSLELSPPWHPSYFSTSVELFTDAPLWTFLSLIQPTGPGSARAASTEYRRSNSGRISLISAIDITRPRRPRPYEQRQVLKHGERGLGTPSPSHFAHYRPTLDRSWDCRSTPDMVARRRVVIHSLRGVSTACKSIDGKSMGG